jgi:iron(III) transport system ATP-binding protein
MLEVRNLAKSYSGAPVLEGLSLRVETGESLVVCGPSGSGKTTLLRLIAGLETPSAGEILLSGQVASRADWMLPPSARNLGFVFQSSALWPHLTVAANIRFGLHAKPRIEARSRLDELLEQTGVAHLAGRYPHQISGDEARRVALARALAPRPRFLLLDEPLAHLNLELKREMLALIRRYGQERDVCIVYVTHDAEEGRVISTRSLNLPTDSLRAG